MREVRKGQTGGVGFASSGWVRSARSAAGGGQEMSRVERLQENREKRGGGWGQKGISVNKDCFKEMCTDTG